MQRRRKAASANLGVFVYTFASLRETIEQF